MSCVNKTIFIGHLGRDPEIKKTKEGKKFAVLSLATSRAWKDKTSGERKERTQWHRILVFNEGLAGVVEQYAKKGSKLYVEGMLDYQTWTDNKGVERVSAFISLEDFGGVITLLDRADGAARPPAPSQPEGSTVRPAGTPVAGGRTDLDDEIPF